MQHTGSDASSSEASIRDAAARHEQITELAYYIAQRRGFSPGYELDDWLQAEQEWETSLEPIKPY
jgi:hypothetical protein